MNQENFKICGTSSTLLSEGKSTRLMEMRKKTVSIIEEPIEAQHIDEVATLDKPTKKELLQARQIVDQQLNDILGTYPPNKQAKFFKIRFGMDIDQLKGLSIKKIYSVLVIKQNKPGSLERIAGMDYFGRFLSK